VAEHVLSYIHEFEAAMRFDEYLSVVEKNADLWLGIHARASVHASDIARIEATNTQWHLLVISEDWCGDAVNTVPVVARLAEQAGNVDMRIITRDDHLDIMDRHLSPAGARAIPVVMVLNEAFEEVGWWGSRPTELQAWVMAEGRQMDTPERYKHIRTWYARDRGETTVREILGIIEGASRRG
jgi:hypothetical protein